MQIENKINPTPHSIAWRSIFSKLLVHCTVCIRPTLFKHYIATSNRRKTTKILSRLFAFEFAMHCCASAAFKVIRPFKIAKTMISYPVYKYFIYNTVRGIINLKVLRGTRGYGNNNKE